MKREDMRRLLREADPAEGRELSPVERARIRAAIAGASGRATARGATWPALALAAAGAALAFFFYMSPREASRPMPSRAASVPEPVAAPAVPAVPAPAVVATVAKVPPRHPARAHVARREQEGPPTRIVFTAPEGTRILWFVGTPDAKELGS